tara:strand:- start:3048 stop:3908 length:861 start_codon:yes stop_codon:yes gene_type:complete
MVLGVLTSGNLGHNTLIQIESKFVIGFVLTDSNSIKIIDFCQAKKIPFYCGNPRNNRLYKFIKNISVDIIISINYIFLIEKDIIDHSNKLTFNIHGSLLPKYRGRTPHVWAIINNEKETGITAHKIDEGCDTGDIIDQIVISIDISDTGNDILEKFKKHYFKLVCDIISKFKNNELKFRKQNEKFATFFGKRTPSDGKIDWDWQKERIHNWVRAQTNPYPGAFTFFENNKIIIDEVKFSEIGYDSKIENGVVIVNEPNIIVKTPNGALELIKLRTPVSLEIGCKLN